MYFVQDESSLAGHVGERAVRGGDDDSSSIAEQPVTLTAKPDPFERSVREEKKLDTKPIVEGT